LINNKIMIHNYEQMLIKMKTRKKKSQSLYNKQIVTRVKIIM